MTLLNLVSTWWIFILPAISIPWLCNDLKSTMLIAMFSSILSWVPFLIYSYFSGGYILFYRVSQMIGLSGSFQLIFISGIFVAFLGGLAGICGFYTKELFNDR